MDFFIWNSWKSICCSLLTRVKPGKKKVEDKTKDEKVIPSGVVFFFFFF